MRSLYSFIILSFFLVYSLQGQESGQMSQVPTTWPGVVFQVSSIKRLDSTHILMVIRLKSDGSASEPMVIGEVPKEAKADRAKRSKSGRQRLEDPEELPKAFSLTSARMVDESTRQEYSALPSLPPKPYFGPNAMVTTLGPGGWIQMAVYFNAPPPLPVGENGKTPLQKVTVLLPRAVKPLSGLVIPAIVEGDAVAKP